MIKNLESIVVTGTSSLTIPFRRKPYSVTATFGPECDINYPTCYPTCPLDTVGASIQYLGNRRWGVVITWSVLGGRVRKINYEVILKGSMRIHY